jgi:hypothetical protein
VLLDALLQKRGQERRRKIPLLETLEESVPKTPRSSRIEPISDRNEPTQPSGEIPMLECCRPDCGTPNVYTSSAENISTRERSDLQISTTVLATSCRTRTPCSFLQKNSGVRLKKQFCLSSTGGAGRPRTNLCMLCTTSEIAYYLI